MRQFNCVFGSSWTDVCLNTYGSLDYYVKLLNDNGVEPNQQPYSGQPIVWDETLVQNQTISTTIRKNNIIYATLTGFGNQVNPISTMYKDPLNAQYVATSDGETVITITALQGNEIISVTKEVKQLLTSEYIFDAIAGTVTLVGGLSLAEGESLFVLYKKTVVV